jgi:cardiolipin synthase
MGALLDPVVDRMLVVSGVVVAWDHHLLPRWALVVLAVRELSMVALGRLALRNHVELRINWPGRLAVAPVMGSFFFAMAGVHGLAVALLYIGLALALTASALYLRYGLQARARPSSTA